MTKTEKKSLTRAVYLLGQPNGYEEAIDILLKMLGRTTMAEVLGDSEGLTPDEHLRKYPLKPEETRE